jgi:hypothetical protein
LAVSHHQARRAAPGDVFVDLVDKRIEFVFNVADFLNKNPEVFLDGFYRCRIKQSGVSVCEYGLHLAQSTQSAISTLAAHLTSIIAEG